MTKQDDKKLSDKSNKKKWLTLSLMGVALLLIPRRSSRQDSAPIDKKYNKPDNNNNPSLP
ncbi:hypothetical protein [Psychrobacter sp. GP33]|uniref:hypothetical protein n=1 Tax=Psychrobacter sp. GP33 TaxID=2758709 RepID=UPI0015FD6961|nr:hypothetical protein [Psychrobacter sp. GP33]